MEEDDDLMKSLRRKGDIMREENEKVEASDDDENNDLYEYAYKIALLGKYAEIMKDELNKKVMERGMNETQAWKIIAAMKLKVDDEFRNKN